jgi:uroporphyrinogen-III synthase
MNPTLNGLRILNTRPKEQGKMLSQLITEAGGVSIDYPTLEIKEFNPNWVRDLPDLNKVDHALFISANAVHYCFNQLHQHKIQWPKHIHITVIGQGTEKALEQFELKADDIPPISNSEHLLALPSMQQLKNKTVLLFKGLGGRTLIEEGLKKKGAKLFLFAVYQRIMPVLDQQFTTRLWQDDGLDIILLTSEQSIHHLFKLFSREAHNWLKDKPCLVLSERLAEAASLLGMKKIKTSHPNRIIDTLFDYKDSIHG